MNAIIFIIGLLKTEPINVNNDGNKNKYSIKSVTPFSKKRLPYDAKAKQLNEETTPVIVPILFPQIRTHLLN